MSEYAVVSHDGFRMTAYMRDRFWLPLQQSVPFRLTLIQGAFNADVNASAGTHDGAGCIDVSVQGLTHHQIERVVRQARRLGAAAWHRDQARGGFSPHIHINLGGDRPKAQQARLQWLAYVKNGYGGYGGDGLADGRPDYEWRPTPLVTRPPEADMQLSDKLYPNAKNNDTTVGDLLHKLNGFLNNFGSVRKSIADLQAAVDRNATPAEIKAMLNNLDATIQLVVNDTQGS